LLNGRAFRYIRGMQQAKLPGLSSLALLALGLLLRLAR
jgi:hypothetical protein